jgi:hypothetical protein
MQEIPIAQLLLLIAFILLPLLNLLFRRMQRRVENQTPREERGSQIPRRTRTIPPSPEVTPSAPERIRRAELPEALSVRKRRSIRRSLFRTRRDLRRGIILMTILGPCRAVASPEEADRRIF